MKIKYVISILVLSFAMFFYSSNIKAIEGSLGKISQIGQTEPAGDTRRCTMVHREAKFVHSKGA